MCQRAGKPHDKIAFKTSVNNFHLRSFGHNYWKRSSGVETCKYSDSQSKRAAATDLKKDGSRPSDPSSQV